MLKLSAMDIFLLTSLWEGLPRTIPQALSMGIPVIANRVGGIPEVIQEGMSGYLCHPGDINKTAEVCIYLLNHPIKRAEMGRKGRTYVKNEFSLDVTHICPMRISTCKNSVILNNLLWYSPLPI